MINSTRLQLAAFAAACALTSLQARAQVGPIEPIIVASSKPSQTLANIPEMSEDYVVPVEVTVAPDGSVKAVVVSTPSGNESADNTAIKFMMEQKFLPALDVNAQPVEARALGSVEVRSKTRNKQLKANMKRPNTTNEVARVRKLTCKDFLWEIARLRNEGASTDLPHETMPWVSLRVYLLDKKMPKDAEPRYLERWPQALREAEAACKATPDKLYLTDTLVQILDSLAPNR